MRTARRTRAAKVGTGEQSRRCGDDGSDRVQAGMPVTVMPIEANDATSERSTPAFGKIMCLL